MGDPGCRELAHAFSAMGNDPFGMIDIINVNRLPGGAYLDGGTSSGAAAAVWAAHTACPMDGRQKRAGMRILVPRPSLRTRAGGDDLWPSYGGRVHASTPGWECGHRGIGLQGAWIPEWRMVDTPPTQATCQCQSTRTEPGWAAAGLQAVPRHFGPAGTAAQRKRTPSPRVRRVDLRARLLGIISLDGLVLVSIGRQM